MDLNAAISPTVQAADVAHATSGQRVDRAAQFAAELDTAQRTDAETRQAAEQLVGIALILPMLKQARNDPFRSDLFHGGQGEETFGAQQDQMIADRMAGRSVTALVDAVYAKFTNPATRSQEADLVG